MQQPHNQQYQQYQQSLSSSQCPEVYANGFLMSVNAYDIAIKLVDRGDNAEHPNPPKVVIRLPIQTSKELAIALRKLLKEVETRTGSNIPIDPAYMNKLGIGPDDMNIWW